MFRGGWRCSRLDCLPNHIVGRVNWIGTLGGPYLLVVILYSGINHAQSCEFVMRCEIRIELSRVIVRANIGTD